MVDESWDVFIKRVFVEKHISGIMFENPRRGSRPLAPSTNAYESSNFIIPKVTCNL